MQAALDNALANNWGYTGQNVEVVRGADEVLHLNCTVTPVHCVDAPEMRMLLELQPIDQQLKASREERLIESRKPTGS